MTTLLYSHPACVEHDPGAHHPENPARLEAVLAALDSEEFAMLDRREAPQADIADIERVHAPEYVAAVFDAVPKSGHVHLDPDTVLSPATGEAALRAAGAVTAAAAAVIGGEADNAFCAVRPPGHHAEAAQAMGFCVFNNVAVAAGHARAVHGLERVAVVDFDVHHGNGTQSAFERDAGLFYASSHQFPFYPGTGSEAEEGVGNIVNVELAPGSGSAEFRAGWSGRILPRLKDFAPELLIISAGFDAHVRDPLAQISLTEDDYAWLTGELMAVAGECCAGRVVSALEGGYDLESLAASAAAHVRVLTGG